MINPPKPIRLFFINALRGEEFWFIFLGLSIKNIHKIQAIQILECLRKCAEESISHGGSKLNRS
jgi:hypothetical protein